MALGKPGKTAKVRSRGVSKRRGKVLEKTPCNYTQCGLDKLSLQIYTDIESFVPPFSKIECSTGHGHWRNDCMVISIEERTKFIKIDLFID